MNNEYIGDDVHGQPIYIGDTVRVVANPYVDDEAVGNEGVVTGPPMFPVPAQLQSKVGGTFFSAYFKGDGNKGMSTSVVEKITS